MISKNFTKYFQIPLYWLTLLVFFFLVSSLMPMLTGYFVSLLTSGTDKHEVFRIFGPNFPSLMSFLSSLAFSIALSLFLWSKILRPIGSISLAAKQVADGDFSVHVPNSKSLQAICELTDNFNRMVQELNSIESLRNDFVTTVSHEFKTPLAAIEGYATLLQDPSLSEADRNEYTRIIIDSTRQLTTMTGNILLPSRLEKQEIVTGRTTFSLDEQIRQAILLLEPLWEKKHLNLDIDLTACKFYGNCEMLQQVCPFRTFRYLDKIIYLLLLSAPSEMIRIQKALNEASHISKHYNQVAFSCGIGSICEKLEELPASFSQAMEALEYSVVSAEESVTSYQDVELYENHVYTSISTEELEMAIKLEDQEKVQKEVEKLVTQLEESHYNFNAYQSAILEIIFSISGIFRQYHMMDDEIFADAKRMTMKVLSLETGEQLNAWLLNYCDYIIYAIHQRKVDRNSILAQKAMEYVQQHYGNAELSVDEVCAYLHVSTSHFSNLFRKETGMSFLAFLTKKRMDEAVRLLKTTDEKSRVIGEMVGYPEPNYFSYVFKKNMGMSPAKFRKELATEN